MPVRVGFQLEKGLLTDALQKLSVCTNYVLRMRDPKQTRRDSGGWVDSRQVIRYLAGWLCRDYAGCLREMLLLMVCQKDRKGGRFQVAMPLLEGDYDRITGRVK